jgi:hypothetical protein
MFIHYLCHLPSTPSNPHPCFQAEPVHSHLLWFYWRENIKDNKKDILFMLVRDKDNYTDRFLAFASAHLCIASHIGSFLPDLFPKSWSTFHSGLW